MPPNLLHLKVWHLFPNTLFHLEITPYISNQLFLLYGKNWQMYVNIFRLQVFPLLIK
jgi:hypothetical protein